MPPLVQIRMKFNNAGMAASLRALRDKSRKVPSFLVNRSCRKIARLTMATMPVVLPSRMDAELQATMSPAILESGKRSTAKSRQREVVNLPQRSAAAMIVIASMHPGSKYNIRTGNVFERKMLPPSGAMQGAWRFWQEIDVIAERMVKARHSSSGFFRLCAEVVFWMFSAATDKNPVISSAALTGFDALPGTGNVSKNIGKLAGGTVATGDRNNARATFWVTATEPDTKGKPGGAIYRVAQPVWQRAVDAIAAENYAEASTAYSEVSRDSGIKVV